MAEGDRYDERGNTRTSFSFWFIEVGEEPKRRDYLVTS